MYISISNVCLILGVSLSTVYRMLKQGILKESFRTEGNHRRFNVQEIHQILRKPCEPRVVQRGSKESGSLSWTTGSLQPLQSARMCHLVFPVGLKQYLKNLFKSIHVIIVLRSIFIVRLSVNKGV